jgi:hypothetical protein
MFPMLLMNPTALPWLILFLPLAAAGIITLFTQRDRRTSAALSIGAVVTGFVLTLGLLTGSCLAAPTNDLFSDLDHLCVLGRKAPDSLSDSVFDRIEQQGTNISAVLLKKLGEQGDDEQKLAVYVWALGLSRDPQAIPAIIKLADRSRTEALKGNCLRSLAEIGGDKAGRYLSAALDQTKAREQRFDLFNLLGQMQYEAALPKTIEVLECDPKEEYWRPNFVFGKMGDKAVRFLVEQLNHTNRNVRANAIGMLGQWVMAPDAIPPLRDRFWREDDAEIRRLIYSSVTGTSSERVFKDFLAEVVTKEKDSRTVEAAKAALDTFREKNDKFVSLKKKKNPSAKRFQREYAVLYKSFGKEGSYEILDKSSTLADEPALKRLRERILRRDSDEAFYDYGKVTATIWLNRFPY